eukprot:scaffold42442_cov411-Skeletonema_dohrnii-CCMP3373.AAC.2
MNPPPRHSIPTMHKWKMSMMISRGSDGGRTNPSKFTLMVHIIKKLEVVQLLDVMDMGLLIFAT